MKKILKITEKFIMALCVALAIWICASFTEVIVKNLSADHTYSKYNLFCVILNYAGDTTNNIKNIY